ncbi:MAG: Ni/Fe hydrogenase subunit alpha [Armatimonadota bacterium]|nr:Ni/Fe hydrogenase subunit alpha [Armatimonadota bacterium]MDW8155564.1 Ni/Fe hydrogenase subunit alpha [Armatimonadota bacterium]
MSEARRPTRTVRVDALARVEGEGRLWVRMRRGRVEEVRLDIYEPPRFFEALLRGRDFREAVDITARICGICPWAYQMSAAQAMEDACGIRVPRGVRDLRRLVYCGEWIESHALHVYLLHAPDFLGYDSAVHMARDHPEAVRRGLELRKVGNLVMSLVAGRSVHPVNARVGGFYRVPTREELQSLVDPLRRARDLAEQTVRWVAAFPFPGLEREVEFVALRHAEEYPILEGRIASSGGLDVSVREYEEHFQEIQVPHSTALHSLLHGRPYVVGPTARFNLNFDRLTPSVQDLAREVGVVPPCRNPFQSIVVRSLEILYACEEALRLVEAYEPPAEPAVDVQPREGVGCAATEAPRGVLYHRYRLDASGTIREAKIVPPTAQNQRSVEEDLRAFVQENLHLDHRQLTWRCEQVVRNYDPCISCATHFLRLEVVRE